MTFRPVFETGSMTGLITLFSRHSGFLTNFSIFIMESRLIGSRRAYTGCGSQGVRRGPGGPLECPGDTVLRAWDSGWALAIPIRGAGRWVPGIAPSQYPPSRTPGSTPPWYPPTRTRPRDHRTGVPECTNTHFTADQGDPRGQ